MALQQALQQAIGRGGILPGGSFGTKSGSISGTYLQDPAAARRTTGRIESAMDAVAPRTWEQYAGLLGDPTQFTNVRESAFEPFSAQNIQQESNQLFSDADARAAAEGRRLRQSLRPGFGSGSNVLQELVNASQGRATAGAQQAARQFQTQAGVANATAAARAAQIQGQIDAQRVAQTLGRAQAQTGMRGTDLQGTVGLANVLAQYAGPQQFSYQQAVGDPYVMGYGGYPGLGHRGQGRMIGILG